MIRLEFNQLESFLSVVKHKSFSKAAKELFITQPTVSNNIGALEKSLETVLLDRKSKTVTITESGKILHGYAAELINLREKAKHAIKDHSDKLEGTIEINVSSIPEQYIIPHIIRDFIKKYPGISFSISNLNSKDIIENIIEGNLNFGIVGVKYPSVALDYLSFYEDELVLAVCGKDSDYSSYHGDVLGLDALLEEKFILRGESSGTRLFLEQRLNESGVSIDDLNIVSLIDSNETIKKMVELGLGVSFVSKVSIESEVDSGLIRPFNVEGLNLKRNFYFVYSKNRTLSPIIEVFKDFISDWIL